jgi:hypothetical protein
VVVGASGASGAATAASLTISGESD